MRQSSGLNSALPHLGTGKQILVAAGAQAAQLIVRVLFVLPEHQGKSRDEPPCASGSELALFLDTALIAPDTLLPHAAMGRRGDAAARTPARPAEPAQDVLSPEHKVLSRPRRGAGQHCAGGSRSIPAPSPSPGTHGYPVPWCSRTGGRAGPCFWGKSCPHCPPCSCLCVDKMPHPQHSTSCAVGVKRSTRSLPCPSLLHFHPAQPWMLLAAPAQPSRDVPGWESCRPRAHLCRVGGKTGGAP